jgi:hypothetical protein
MMTMDGQVRRRPKEMTLSENVTSSPERPRGKASFSNV